MATYYASLFFDANGGSGAPAEQYGSSTDGTGYVKITIPLTEPVRSGYTFSGWATSASGSETIRYPGGTYTGYGTTTSPGPRHTLYAIWTEAASSYYLNVSLDLNGGSWNGYTPSYGVDYGVIGPDTNLYVAYTLPSIQPVRSNYTFAGWYCNKTGATYSAGHSNRWYGSLSTSGQPYTFVAQWAESSSEGVWVFYDGVWKKATPYVFYDGVWKKATPYVFYNGVWKKSTI